MSLRHARALGSLPIRRRRKNVGDPPIAAAGGPVQQRFASAGGRARRALALLAVSSLLGISGVVAASTSPASASSFLVDLFASASTVPTGQAVTLTADTDPGVGATDNFYIDIFDSTTGTLISQCPNGVTCQASVAQSVASTQAYVAYVAEWDQSGGPPPQIQATSAETDYLTWTNRGFQISLGGPDSVPAGKGATYVATTNVSIPPARAFIQIDNETTGKVLGTCVSSSCSVNYKPADINGDDLVAFLFSSVMITHTFAPLASSNVFFTFQQ